MGMVYTISRAYCSIRSLVISYIYPSNPSPWNFILLCPYMIESLSTVHKENKVFWVSGSVYYVSFLHISKCSISSCTTNSHLVYYTASNLLLIHDTNTDNCYRNYSLSAGLKLTTVPLCYKVNACFKSFDPPDICWSNCFYG